MDDCYEVNTLTLGFKWLWLCEPLQSIMIGIKSISSNRRIRTTTTFKDTIIGEKRTNIGVGSTCFSLQQKIRTKDSEFHKPWNVERRESRFYQHPWNNVQERKT